MTTQLDIKHRTKTHKVTTQHEGVTWEFEYTVLREPWFNRFKRTAKWYLWFKWVSKLPKFGHQTHYEVKHG